MNLLAKLLKSLGFVKSKGPQLSASNDQLDRQVHTAKPMKITMPEGGFKEPGPDDPVYLFSDPRFIGVHSPDQGKTWFDSSTGEEIPDPGVVERDDELPHHTWAG